MKNGLQQQAVFMLQKYVGARIARPMVLHKFNGRILSAPACYKYEML